MNGNLASLFLDELIEQGVKYYALSPGSRSTPLVLYLTERKEVELFTHFDERGASFHAIGYSHNGNSLAAMITTSGSALANLYPAVLESLYNEIPLLLLTADRPSSYIYKGHNQTINQTDIFSSNVIWSHALSSEHSPSDIRWTAAYALHLAQNKKGPVHINFHFNDELYPLTFSSSDKKVAFHFSPLTQTKPSNKILLDGFKKGAILMGQMRDTSLFSRIYSIAEQLQWPVICDINSQHHLFSHPHTIPYHSLMAKGHLLPKPEVILHFGGKFVDKHLFLFLLKSRPERYIHCGTMRIDPYDLVSEEYFSSVSCCVDAIQWESHASLEWLSIWKERTEQIKEILFQAYAMYPRAEPSYIHLISKSIPSHSPIFLGNSLPIRHAENHFSTRRCYGPIFSNRGCSGIDGNIATAAGIGACYKQRVVAIIGDQTALHDINSLVQYKKLSTPITLFVINNGGGEIFSHLPVHLSPHCSSYFINSHSLCFRGIADTFQLNYYYQENFLIAFKEENSSLIEITPDKDQTIAFNAFVDSKLRSIQQQSEVNIL